jgi:hypothetical protein
MHAVWQAEAAPPFLAAGWDYEDSFRDGCGVLDALLKALLSFNDPIESPVEF